MVSPAKLSPGRADAMEIERPAAGNDGHVASTTITKISQISCMHIFGIYISEGWQLILDRSDQCIGLLSQHR